MKYTLGLAALFGGCSVAFVPHSPARAPWVVKKTSKGTELNMVFDFFKKRSEEGLEQLSNLANEAAKGNIGKGFLDIAEYTDQTNTKFAEGLAKSRDRMLQNMEILFTGNSEDMLEDLTDVLLQADLGMTTAEDIVQEVKSLGGEKRFKSRDDIMSVMRGKLIEALQIEGSGSISFSQDDFPTVLFIMGANGMGKTTTIGKLAHRLRTEGNQTVLMAACDTFRAGAVEQLVQWADRAEVDCFTPDEQAKSPAAVLYGALDKAVTEKYDTLLVDTSGRLSNNDALNLELEKMKRVIQKRLSVEKDADGKPVFNSEVPHETLVVIDAAQGRMALDSAKVWNEEIGLSGLILTKLDGSARGGSVVAVSRELNLPVKLIGVGEGIEDLRDFEPERFVDGLLGIGKAGGKGSSSEGEKLASRLSVMRKERDEKAKNTVKATPTPPQPVAPAFGGNPGADAGAGGLTFEEMDFDSEPVGVGGRTAPKKKNNKKKSKKKRKKK